MADTNYSVDIEGTVLVSNGVLTLLNSFPGLPDGKEVEFSTLSDTSGIGMFPTSGAVLISDTESVTGHVKQKCAYPFTVVYRAAPKTQEQRLRIKELLDMLGRWVEGQTVMINGTTTALKSYSEISKYLGDDDTREITLISRTTPGHLDKVYEDGIEDWVISLTVYYKNEFDR